MEGALNNGEIHKESFRSTKIRSVNHSIGYKDTGNQTTTSYLGNSSISRRAKRGKPQEGVLTPLLWLIVVNKTLLTFDKENIRAGGYANDWVLMVEGKDFSTVSYFMEAAPKELSNWAEGNGLWINPSKIELVPSARKYKVHNSGVPE